MTVSTRPAQRDHRALSWTIEGRNAPVGLIHVVSWGHHRLWREEDDKALQEVNPAPTREGNEELRRELLQLEIEDLRGVCERLKAPSVQQRLRWLVVAVAKCDLFWSELDRARDYYIPGGSSGPSDFHRILEGLPQATAACHPGSSSYRSAGIHRPTSTPRACTGRRPSWIRSRPPRCATASTRCCEG